MAQPTNPNSGLPPADAERRRVEHQETLLLSDVPDATAVVPEQPAPAERHVEPQPGNTCGSVAAVRHPRRGWTREHGQRV